METRWLYIRLFPFKFPSMSLFLSLKAISSRTCKFDPPVSLITI